ncbi:hypothetical protein AB0N23_35075 [Streptomyces sp. NPDC052644]
MPEPEGAAVREHRPRTARTHPGDPTVVNYVRIDRNRYQASPASVDVTVWSVRS